MSYGRKNRERVEHLLERAQHLRDRLTPSKHFDRAELAALRWAFEAIVKAHGTLPSDLEAWRAELWPPEAAPPMTPGCTCVVVVSSARRREIGTIGADRCAVHGNSAAPAPSARPAQ